MVSLSPKNGRLHWLHWLIIASSLCMTLFAWFISKEQIEEKAQRRFNREATQVVSLVHERVDKYADALWGGAAFITAVDNQLTHKDWASYSQALQLEKKYPGINGIGVIYALHSKKSLALFESNHQKTRPNFKAYPTHNETESWPITYIEPLAANRAAVGLDMAHEANRFSAAKKAAKTGTAQITAPIILVQDKEKTPGFLFYAPFYKSTPYPNKHKLFLGLVYAPFIFKNLANGVLEQKHRLVNIAINDQGEPLFNEHPESFNKKITKHHNPYQKIISQSMYGRTWTYNIQATPDFYRSIKSNQPTIILITGIVIEILLIFLFVTLARSHRKSVTYAQKATKNLQKKTQDLDKLAHFDALTDLPNRRSFLNKLEESIEKAKKNNTKVAVFFMDIDDFKFINDSYGHHVADQLLTTLPQLLFPQLKHLNHFMARLSGDEFGLIINNIENIKSLIPTIKACLKTINQTTQIGTHEIIPSISVGIACYPDNGTSNSSLIACADIAMYHAKQTGKNNYKFYNKEIDNLLKREHKLHNHLQEALQKKEFSLAYQPQIDIKNNQLTGVEALLRWNNPDIGSVSPEEFIKIAESNGIIINIGKWVISQACQDLISIQNQNPSLSSLKMAVNTSARELESNSYTALVQSIFIKHNINPSDFEFEVTESLLMKNIQDSSKTIKELKQLGSSIALDDFGTGYSSMKYLKSLDLNLLKIDKCFIQDMLFNADSKTIVIAMITLAHGLGLKVLAEGVETREQLAYLKAQDCDYAQGYYFSKPLSYEDFIDWALARKRKTP